MTEEYEDITVLTETVLEGINYLNEEIEILQGEHNSVYRFIHLYIPPQSCGKFHSGVDPASKKIIDGKSYCKEVLDQNPVKLNRRKKIEPAHTLPDLILSLAKSFGKPVGEDVII